jgi:hypothetical protein
VAEVAAAAVLITRRGGKVSAPAGGGAGACDDERTQALAHEVEALRARLVQLQRRAGAPAPPEAVPPRELMPPAPPALHGEEPARAPPARAPAPPATSDGDHTMARVDDLQAREPLDARWAAQAEARLRDLALALGAGATLERVRCTGTLCRLELAHGAGALSERLLQTFVAGAQDLMPEVMVLSDPTGKTTIVFARAGASLPAAEGGGGS